MSEPRVVATGSTSVLNYRSHRYRSGFDTKGEVPTRSKHHPWRFERRHERLAPFSIFAKRVLGSFGVALLLVGFALTVGIAGYHLFAGFGWVDSLLEASMLLGGMGPVNPLPNDAAKIFASAYALFSGLLFIVIMGVVLSPLAHRVMHKFHIEEKE